MGLSNEEKLSGPFEGLTRDIIQEKRKKFGYNEIPEKKVNLAEGILKRLWGPIPFLLEAAMIFEFFLGKSIQAAVIFLLLMFSAVTGEIQERRAKRAMNFLGQKLQIQNLVLRNKKWKKIPSRELLPGDLVSIQMGDLITADMKILQGTVAVSEAVITGESGDVLKTASNQDKLFSGSMIHHGKGIAEVIAIGSKSSYGQMVGLVNQSEAPGRLQSLLFKIVRYLAYLDLVLAIVLLVAAFYRGVAWQELLPFLIILFIATIPISMPSSFVVANSLEAQYLAKNQVLVSGLTGIQEAANMDLLLIDKTGTLTCNQSEVTKLLSFTDKSERELLQLALAAVDERAQDSISQAIVRLAKDREISGLERCSFSGFNPSKKYSEAEIILEREKLNILLGSPIVLGKLTKLPEHYEEETSRLSAKGSRVLVLAMREDADKFVCLGILVLSDRLREEAQSAVTEIQKLGIRVMMLTGDTVKVAQKVAEEVGIGSHIGGIEDLRTSLQSSSALQKFDGFAGIYPKDKYLLVKRFQEMGFVVGMTGDGINDAPALKQADVGIAVNSAADAAKKAAKIVLTKPTLSLIPQVIASGHRVYQRMMTWTITKLSRTAELAALLTFGFLFTGFFPVSLNLIVFIIVLNDLVTLTLGTDRVSSIKKVERWNFNKLARISAIFALAWLVIGLGLMSYYLMAEQLSADQISSLMFLYLIFSAMSTILMTRTRNFFLSFAPSKSLTAMIIFNILFSIFLAFSGSFMSAVPIVKIMILLIITVIALFLLDGIKILYYRKIDILEK